MKKLPLLVFLVILLTACGGEVASSDQLTQKVQSVNAANATPTPEPKPTNTPKPESTPKPTVTPKPEPTSRPTNTPRPAPTVAPTLTTEQQTTALTNSYFKDSTATTSPNQDGGDKMLVKYNIKTAFDERSFIKGVLYDSQKGIPAIFEKLPNVQYLNIIATTEFKDVKGNASIQDGVRLGVSRKTSLGISWKGINIDNFDLIIDSFYVHPGLAKAWNEIKAGK